MHPSTRNQIDRSRDARVVVDQQIDFEPGGALAVANGDAFVEQLATVTMHFREVVLTQDFHPPGHLYFASSYRDRDPYTVITLPELREGGVTLSTSAAFTLGDLHEYLQEARDQMQILLPDHCEFGSRGGGIDPRFDRQQAIELLRMGYRPSADSYSAFTESDGTSTGRAEMLIATGISRVFVTGLAGDYCVFGSAPDAADSELDVVCLRDLTRFGNPPEGTKEKALWEMGSVGVTLSGWIDEESEPE